MQHWVGPLARGRPGADPTAWGGQRGAVEAGGEVSSWGSAVYRPVSWGNLSVPPSGTPFTSVNHTRINHAHVRDGCEDRRGSYVLPRPGQARPGRGASRGHCRPPPPQPGPQPWRWPSSQQLPCSSSPRGHFHIHEASGSLCPAQAWRNLASLVTVGSRKTSLRSNGSWVPLARQQPGAQAKSF